MKCSKLVCSEIPEELPPSGHASDDLNSDVEEPIEDDSIDDYADDFEEYDSDEVSKQNLRLNLGMWVIDLFRQRSPPNGSGRN